jgi:hypothetical protein
VFNNYTYTLETIIQAAKEHGDHTGAVPRERGPASSRQVKSISSYAQPLDLTSSHHRGVQAVQFLITLVLRSSAPDFARRALSLFLFTEGGAGHIHPYPCANLMGTFSDHSLRVSRRSPGGQP